MKPKGPAYVVLVRFRGKRREQRSGPFTLGAAERVAEAFAARRGVRAVSVEKDDGSDRPVTRAELEKALGEALGVIRAQVMADGRF